MENQSSTSCSAISEALDAYLDLELSPDEAQNVESHLANCSACERRLAEIESLVAKLKTLPEPVLSRDLADSIESRIRANEINNLETVSADNSANTVSDLNAFRQKKEERAKKAPSLLRPLLTAVAALALLVGGASFVLNKQDNLVATNPDRQAVTKTAAGRSAVSSANADDLIAEYDDIVGDGVNDFGGVNNYGLSTNEDGLYAIKL